MKIKSLKIIVIGFLFLGCLSKTRNQQLSFPEWIFMPFPELNFKQISSSEDRKRLGLSDSETFSLKDIDADVLIVEYLSVYCYSCQLQTPIFNELYAAIQQDTNLKSKVKMIGIGAGNNQREVEKYRKEKNIPYPILPDPKFEAYDAIGKAGGTPFTILIKKTRKGDRLVLNYYLGLIRDYEDLLNEVKSALKADLTAIQFNEGEYFTVDYRKKLKPELSEEQITAKVKEIMRTLSDEVQNVERALLPGDDMVYIGKLSSTEREKQLIATVVRRDSVCDVCGVLHFIYVFNDKGEILNFTPISVYKHGNKVWDEEDTKKMESRILGRSIFEEFEFNPEVDAVSTATISSKLIFDSLDRAKRNLKELKKKRDVN
ncbi:TPA: redoxin domain-containing protein [Candidatus Poribacteria bacterium]|nr:redoxin domain-containing protein [Candidatus Poribacteria bacterium]